MGDNKNLNDNNEEINISKGKNNSSNDSNNGENEINFNPASNLKSVQLSDDSKDVNTLEND